MNTTLAEPLSAKTQHPRIQILRWTALLIAAWVQIGKLDHNRTDHWIPNQPAALTNILPNETGVSHALHIQTTSNHSLHPLAKTRNHHWQSLVAHNAGTDALAPQCQSLPAALKTNWHNFHCSRDNQPPQQAITNSIDNIAMTTSPSKLLQGSELRGVSQDRNNMLVVELIGQPCFAESRSARSSRGMPRTSSV